MTNDKITMHIDYIGIHSKMIGAMHVYGGKKIGPTEESVNLKKIICRF